MLVFVIPFDSVIVRVNGVLGNGVVITPVIVLDEPEYII